MPDENDRVLDRLRVGRWACVYMVGGAERSLTVVSQQWRALNLVAALARRHRRGRVAVVGAGAAGATAALAAAMEGFQVVLFERTDRLFELFHTVHSRHIHPHMYDWPADGWPEGRAGLPLLDWSAEFAVDVSRTLQAGWDAVATAFPVQRKFHAFVEEVRPGPPPVIVWRSEDGAATHSHEADVAILAPGFGEERDLADFGAKEYWHDHDAHNKLSPGVDSRTYLVSGRGDGGCIDFLKIALGGFHQAKIVEDILPDNAEETRRIKAAVSKLEREHQGNAMEILAGYLEINAPELDAALRSRLHSDSRRGIRVVLNGENELPLDPGAFVLNRFLVARVLKLQGLRLDPTGSLVDPGPYRKGKLRHKAGKPVQIDGEDLPFSVDEFVIRHGPKRDVLPGAQRELKEHPPEPFDVAAARLWDGRASPIEYSQRWELLKVVCKGLGSGVLDLARSVLQLCEGQTGPTVDEWSRLMQDPGYADLETSFFEWFHRFGEHLHPISVEEVQGLVALLRGGWQKQIPAVATARALVVGLDKGFGPGRFLDLFVARTGLTDGTSVELADGDVVPLGPPIPGFETGDKLDCSPSDPFRMHRFRSIRREDLDAAKCVLEWRPYGLPKIEAARQIAIETASQEPTDLRKQMEVAFHILPSSGIAQTAPGSTPAAGPRRIRGGRPRLMVGVGDAGGRRDLEAARVVGDGNGRVRVMFSDGTEREVKHFGKCPSCGRGGRDSQRLVLTLTHHHSLCALVCSDIDHPDILRSIGNLGASIVAVPACELGATRLALRVEELRRDYGVAVVAAWPSGNT